MLGGPYVTSTKTTTPDMSSPSARSRGGRSKDDAENAVPSIYGGYKDGVLTDVPLRDFSHQTSVGKKTDGDYCIGSPNEIRGRHDDCRVSRRMAIACLVLFMMLGGAIATVVIAIAKPGNFQSNINGSVDPSSSSSLRPPTDGEGDSTSDGESNSISTEQEPAIGVPEVPPNDTEAPTSAPSTSAPTAEAEPLPPAEPGFPESCSVEKLREIRKQLPAYSCYPPVYPWSQKCSFSHVTKDCQGYLLAREFYANLDSTSLGGYSFLGVIVGWNQDEAPVDALYVGSHNATRYSTEEWNNVIKYTISCREPITVVNQADAMKAQVMVVEWSDDRYRQLRQAKQSFGLNDVELVLDRTDPELDPDNAISERINFKFPGENRPIHFMEVNGRNFDYLILTKSISMDTLKNVRFLSFEYNWKENWANDDSTLYSLIERLKAAGLACYWAGNREYPQDLWRITDCWSWHYESKQWGHVSCVNTQYDDVQELKDSMEEMFVETMKKDQSFGAAP